jgi:DNA polymerase I-like protein with 3'-5' exonuclease and polymerase domains
MVAFRQLATEGEAGQDYRLKTAMRELLGWPESNEKDLYKWLDDNGLKPGDMAKAPWDILGKYNALDALAAWELYKWFKEISSEYDWCDAYWSYHHDETMTAMELSIEQWLEGIHIDMPQLRQYDKSLELDMADKQQQVFDYPEAKPFIEQYQLELIKKFKKVRPKPDKYTKTGKIASRYSNWVNDIARLKRSKDFNLNSPQQLQWLLYDCMKIKCPIITDTGAISTGKKAVPFMGAIGKLLKAYRKVRDKRKFVTSLKEVERDGKFHPELKISGTVTGRGSGGNEE